MLVQQGSGYKRIKNVTMKVNTDIYDHQMKTIQGQQWCRQSWNRHTWQYAGNDCTQNKRKLGKEKTACWTIYHSMWRLSPVAAYHQTVIWSYTLNETLFSNSSLPHPSLVSLLWGTTWKGKTNFTHIYQQ